ncbi:MAG TPA: polysaccharide pyruvyl transferase family protein, partial [Gemmatimonadales bacterium]|nr:polysaccharide pyruvyl transferase family protein [Gemmatimonadales bacterium]
MSENRESPVTGPVIALHGAYRGGNFGDMLLLGIYAKWIREIMPGSRVILPFMHRSLSGLIDADGRGARHLLGAAALVYGGGGYFGEPDKRQTWWSFRNVLRHLPVGVIARLRGIPIAISGVGAGPLSVPAARRLFVLLFRWAHSATVRDRESRGYLTSYGVSPEALTVTADAALTLDGGDLPAEATREAQAILAGLPGSLRIGVHVAHSIGCAGIQSLIDDLAAFAAAHPEASFVYFLDEGPGRGEEYHLMKKTRLLEQKVGAPGVVVPYRTPSQVVGLIHALDLVITTKLHVGIVGCALGRPVLAFPFHPKTRRFYEQIGAADRCIP